MIFEEILKKTLEFVKTNWTIFLIIFGVILICVYMIGMYNKFCKTKNSSLGFR